MSDNVYIVDTLVTGPATVYKVDREGEDWIEIQGLFDRPTEIRLAWFSENGEAISASGLYYDPETEGHRLIVTGRIENARGSIGRDLIIGNEIGNIIEGDQLFFGVGLDDTLYGGGGTDTIYGGTANDEIAGGDDGDFLFGDSGNDTINGNAGDDSIRGGEGADVLSGGGDAGDVLAYSKSTTGVRVEIAHGQATTCAGGDAEGDVVSGFRQVVGSSFNDHISDKIAETISFGYNANVFKGGDGDDQLELGGGNDTGTGGTGKDRIFGGNGDDMLAGNSNNDSLYGDDGNDELRGDAGNDRLRGGEGNDTLAGGAGEDRFIFGSLDDLSPRVPKDVIEDFTRSERDRIDLRLIDADTTRDGDQAFTFRGKRPYTDTPGELVLKVVEGGIDVRGDWDGDGASDFVIRVEGLTDLLAADFLL